MALLIGLLFANIAKPGAGIVSNNVSADNVAEYSNQAKELNWGEFFSHIVPTNIVDSFAKGDILQVLFFSILFAVGLKWLGEKGNSLLQNFEKINNVLLIF
jgi:aerobic C4-dicarboxylate transport protein